MSDNEFDVIETILSGEPIPLTIGEQTWQLRQPRPLEVDKMRRAQTLAYDSVMKDYRAAGMADEPVSKGMADLIAKYNAAQDTAYVEAMKANNKDAARAALEDMEKMNWPANLAEERAREDARRTTARWVIENLLEGDREEFRKATAPDPLNHSDVVAAVTKMLALINHDPNLNGPKASA